MRHLGGRSSGIFISFPDIVVVVRVLDVVLGHVFCAGRAAFSGDTSDQRWLREVCTYPLTVDQLLCTNRR